MNAVTTIASALPSAVADRAVLTRALDIVSPVVERRNTYPILGNVRLRGDGNVLFITATDLDIVVDVAVPAPADSRFDVTVPALMLTQLLKGAPKADYVAMTMPGEELIAARGNTPEHVEFAGPAMIDFATATYQINALHSSNFPDMKAGEFSHRFTLPGADLFAALDSVEFAISNEETRYYLNGVYMHAIVPHGHNRPELRFVTTDGHRMARQEFTAPDGTTGMPGVIIPKKTVALILKLMKGKNCPESVEVEISASHVRLHFEGVTITSKVIDGTFPDYERVTPKNNVKAVTLGAKAALEAIKAASLVASERGGKAVKMAFEAGRLTLECNNPDGDASSVPLAFTAGDLMPESFEIGFNIRYFAGIVAEARSDTVTMMFNDSGSPTIITGEREGWLSVLMPMRV